VGGGGGGGGGFGSGLGFQRGNTGAKSELLVKK